MSKTYYIYIVTNRPRGVFYVGFTDDLGERVSAHKSGGGSKFTSKYNLTLLVYYETFADPKDAMIARSALNAGSANGKSSLLRNQIRTGLN